ncbi:MAG: cytochrome b/b6 domain-containing protein [Nitrospinae bacterium]|nr:cytochrome b/b6 domain-containing protein [Nitrospinota bacterium]
MKLYLYPLWLRLWHWINAILCIVLIATGISLQYSNPDQPLLVPFDLAIMAHNIASAMLCFNYLGFLVGNIISGEIKQYHFRLKNLLEKILQQVRYYIWGMFRGEKSPFPPSKKSKFNPLQRMTYVSVMFVVMPLTIVSGTALLFPELIIHNVFETGGIYIAALFHSAIGFFISIFLTVHIYLCTFGPTIFSSFKGMLDGYHRSKE